MKFINCSQTLETILSDALRSAEVNELITRNNIKISDLSKLTIAEDRKVSNMFAEFDKKHNIIYFNPSFVTRATDTQIREVFYHELGHFTKVLSGEEDIDKEVESTPSDPDEFKVIKEDVNLKRLEGYSDEQIIDYITKRFWAFQLTEKMIKDLLQREDKVETKEDRPPHSYPNCVEDFTDLSIPFAIAYYYSTSSSPHALSICKENLLNFISRLTFSLDMIEDEVYRVHRPIIRETLEALNELIPVINECSELNDVNVCLQSLRDHLQVTLNKLPYVDTKLGHLSFQLLSVDKSIEKLLRISDVLQNKDKILTNASLTLISRLVQREDGWHVLSESGKHLGGPYSKKKAEERLRQIEMFKHMKASSRWEGKEFDGFKLGDPVSFNMWGKACTGTIIDFSDDCDCDIDPGFHATMTMENGDKYTTDLSSLTKIAAIGNINLWVDDERPMPEGYSQWAKTYDEAVAAISTGNVQKISLDGYLGDIKGGMDIAIFIMESAEKGEIGPIDWEVHSSNPDINVAMNRMMEMAKRFWMKKSASSGLLSLIADLPDQTSTNDSTSIREQVLLPEDMKKTTYHPTEISTTKEERPQDLTWLDKMIQGLRRRKPEELL